jgi:hypothetical protein
MASLEATLKDGLAATVPAQSNSFAATIALTHSSLESLTATMPARQLAFLMPTLLAASRLIFRHTCISCVATTSAAFVLRIPQLHAPTNTQCFCTILCLFHGLQRHLGMHGRTQLLQQASLSLPCLCCPAAS